MVTAVSDSDSDIASLAADGQLPLPWLAAPLHQALTQGRSHALLLQGPAGVGQFDLALLLAQAWLCEQRATPDQPGCGRCASCRLLKSRSHPDFQVLLPEALREPLGFGALEAEGAEPKASKAKPSREIKIEAVRQVLSFSQVSVARGNTGSIVEMLTGYEADIGVLGELGDERPFEVLPLNVSPIIAFAARNHPAATRAKLSLAELSDWPLIMREAGSRTRQMLEQLAAESGIALSYAVEAEGREAVRAIVAAGGGIGFVSAAEFGEDDPRLVRIPLDGPPLLMRETLICLHERRNSKAIQAFFATARALRNPPD